MTTAPNHHAPRTSPKTPRLIHLVTATVLFSFLAGMAVHELGHMLHGWLSGGRVMHVDLVPHRFSSTAISPNPHPQFVAWGGPLWGVALPVLLWLLLERATKSVAYLARFFAGLCLVGNGAYLGLGWINRAGDAGDLLRHRAPLVSLIAFGLVMTPCGFLLWHNLGREFGIGRNAKPVSRPHAWAVTGLLITFVITEYALAPHLAGP